MRVLLVEDDEHIAQALSTTLAEQHYTVDVAMDGQAGWEYSEAFTYDLILLDVMLPKIDGITLCRQLRSRHSNTPILLLTAQNSSASKVEGLDAGADDYVVKPFDFEELSARIRAILRRGGTSALTPVLEWGMLRLNPSTYEVTYADQLLSLTPKEYALLELFLRNPSRVFSRRAILDHLWSFEEPPAEDTVRAHIKGLRSKLKGAGAPADVIETVYGLGYRLKQDWSESKVETGQKAEGKGQKLEETTSALGKVRSTLNDAVAKVWERFKDNISDRVAVLEEAQTALLAGELGEELRQKAGREAHKLAGSLGTFGLAEGSRLAREMELLLQTMPTPDQVPSLSQLVVLLRQALEQANKTSSKSISQGIVEPEDSLEELRPRPANSSGSWKRDDRPLLLIVEEDLVLAEQLVSEALGQGLRTRVVSALAMARDACLLNGNSKPLCPDIVLLDLDLDKGDSGQPLEGREQTVAPGDKLNNSYQLLAELARQTPPVPVLVLAKQGDFTDRVEVARLGGRAFLQKPVLPVQVIEVVLDTLRCSRTTEAKVMVVDDDPHMLETLRVLLEPWGVKTLTLDDPRQFWEVLEAGAPDLLVLDIEMPHLTGIELCQVVRSDPRWRGLPVLFLTAHTDVRTVHHVFAAGADDYVSKPVVGPELVTRILNRLERSQLLRSRAETDALTGVTNRRRSTQDLSQFLRLADRYGQPLCFALLDIDCFKQVNDQYGHAAGDGVLRRLGELLLQIFRSQDVVARWGGEEFVIGMYGMSKQDGMKRLTDVLVSWRQEEFTDAVGNHFRVSFSAGVAEYPADGNDLQSLYRAADGALYWAKKAGRDRVVLVQ